MRLANSSQSQQVGAATLAVALLGGSILFGLSDARAENVVEKYQGRVFVVTPDGVTTQVKGRTRVVNGSSIETGDGSRAVVQTSRGTTVLGERAAMKVESPSWFRQLFGKVYYAIRRVTDSLRTEEPVRVQTQTATMGVRGTEFLVDVDDASESVAMAEGSVSVDSNGDGFNLYRNQVEDEFEAFRREMREGARRLREEFEAYRAAEQREFLGFVRGLQLEAGQSISISGTQAVSDEVSEAQRRAMDELTEFAGELLRQAPEQAMSTD